MHIDIEVAIERARDRARELVDKHGQRLGPITTCQHGTELIASARRFLSAVERFETENCDG